MFQNNQLKKTIINLRKENIPAVLVEAESSEMLSLMERQITTICNEIGLQILCEHMGKRLKIRNLFFSNN